MLVDVADIQWWQTLIAIIVALGLSPGPWVLGLAFGRLQFSKPAAADYNQRVADLKEQHATSNAAIIQAHATSTDAVVKAHEVVIAALVKNHADAIAGYTERIEDLKKSLSKMDDARNVERDRAHAATEMLGRAVEAVEVSNHLLDSLGQVAKEGAA